MSEWKGGVDGAGQLLNQSQREQTSRARSRQRDPQAARLLEQADARDGDVPGNVAGMSLQMRAVALVGRCYLSPRGSRASYDRLKRANLPTPPRAVAAVHDVTVQQIAGTPVVWLDRAKQNDGTIIYLHGGTYIVGPQKVQWQWFSALCRAVGCSGLMIDYSLTPQAAYPIALEQVLGVLSHVTGESRPWALAGDSAGGGLALATSYRLRDEARPLPAALLLSSPWLDLTMSNPAILRSARIDAMLTLRGLSRGAVPYAGATNPRDPHLSPLFGDPVALPSMLVHVGERELFLFDSRDWATRCVQAGVDCTLIEVPGAFHNAAMAVALLPEARRALGEQAAFLTDAFQPRA